MYRFRTKSYEIIEDPSKIVSTFLYTELPLLEFDEMLRYLWRFVPVDLPSPIHMYAALEKRIIVVEGI